MENEKFVHCIQQNGIMHLTYPLPGGLLRPSVVDASLPLWVHHLRQMALAPRKGSFKGSQAESYVIPVEQGGGGGTTA